MSNGEDYMNFGQFPMQNTNLDTLFDNNFKKLKILMNRCQEMERVIRREIVRLKLAKEGGYWARRKQKRDQWLRASSKKGVNMCYAPPSQWRSRAGRGRLPPLAETLPPSCPPE